MATECYLPIDVKLVSRAGWLVRKEGIRVRVAPSPPDVDQECGFSLVFPSEKLELVVALLREAGIGHKDPVEREV